MIRIFIKVGLIVLPNIAFASPCLHPGVVESEIPDASIEWVVSKDEVLGTHYSLKLEKSIDDLELDHVMIFKRNGETLDFSFPLPFSETWQELSTKREFMTTSFSMKEDLQKEVELIAVYKKKR